MSKCRITVLRRTLNADLAQEHCREQASPCSAWREGQKFVTSFAKPQGFCDWAWSDIHQYVAVPLAGGSFAGSVFNGWMKDENTMIACCTDGIRPVIFKLERIEEGTR
jgi:uncharacterized repeat protein (TIGR04076 family)